MTPYHYDNETLQGCSLNKWDYNDKPINANSILFALLPVVEIHTHPETNSNNLKLRKFKKIGNSSKNDPEIICSRIISRGLIVHS